MGVLNCAFELQLLLQPEVGGAGRKKMKEFSVKGSLSHHQFPAGEDGPEQGLCHPSNWGDTRAPPAFLNSWRALCPASCSSATLSLPKVTGTLLPLSPVGHPTAELGDLGQKCQFTHTHCIPAFQQRRNQEPPQTLELWQPAETHQGFCVQT